jgi:hypothetical protein
MLNFSVNKKKWWKDLTVNKPLESKDNYAESNPKVKDKSPKIRTTSAFSLLKLRLAPHRENITFVC